MKKIISISLTLLFLISNVGFTMGTHLCGGLAVASELMLGHTELDCGMSDMDVKKEVMKPEMGTFLNAPPCCQNDFRTLQVDEDFNSTVKGFDLNPIFFVAFVEAFLSVPAVTSVTLNDYNNYSPPIPENDRQSLFQVFLI